MAETPSTMRRLGTTLPAFELRDVVSSKAVTPDDVRGERGLLVTFICNHCPFVKHVLAELGRVARDYQPKGVGVVAISANDVTTHPDDRPELMQALAEREGWRFPYLYDETQKVAKAFEAACTPDFFVYDANDALVYRGQLDDSRPRNGVPVTGRDLRTALDALVAGKPVPVDQKPSLGCNIKWKPGNAPAYC